MSCAAKPTYTAPGHNMGRKIPSVVSYGSPFSAVQACPTCCTPQVCPPDAQDYSFYFPDVLFQSYCETVEKDPASPDWSDAICRGGVYYRQVCYTGVSVCSLTLTYSGCATCSPPPLVHIEQRGYSGVECMPVTGGAIYYDTTVTDSTYDFGTCSVVDNSYFLPNDGTGLPLPCITNPCGAWAADSFSFPDNCVALGVTQTVADGSPYVYTPSGPASDCTTATQICTTTSSVEMYYTDPKSLAEALPDIPLTRRSQYPLDPDYDPDTLCSGNRIHTSSGTNTNCSHCNNYSGMSAYRALYLRLIASEQTPGATAKVAFVFEIEDEAHNITYQNIIGTVTIGGDGTLDATIAAPDAPLNGTVRLVQTTILSYCVDFLGNIKPWAPPLPPPGECCYRLMWEERFVDLVEGMSITSIDLISGGEGYSGSQTLTVSAPEIAGGTQATVSITVVDGHITAVALTNPGSGYTSPGLSFMVSETGTGAEFLIHFGTETTRSLDWQDDELNQITACYDHTNYSTGSLFRVETVNPRIVPCT